MRTMTFSIDIDQAPNEKIVELINLIQSFPGGIRSADYQAHVAGGKAGETYKVNLTDETVTSEAPPPPTVNNVLNFTPPPPVTDVDKSTGEVVLDGAGYPWDIRIHMKSKGRVVKGDTWKLIRSIDKELVKQVQAEQRALGYGVAPTAPAALPPSYAEDPNQTFPPINSVAGVNANTNGAPPPPVATVAVMDFTAVLTKITDDVKAGKYTMAVAEQTVRANGAESLATMAMSTPPVLRQIANALDLL